MSKIKWIAVDWGTTNLRLWAMSPCDEIVDSLEIKCGMSGLKPTEFEATLLHHIANWLPIDGGAIPVVACGMVGAKQGWQEVPYASVPGKLEPALNQIDTKDSRIAVYICSGLSQAQPADVMRGEETQLAGLVFNEPQFSGAVCLPGTHSKWSAIQNGGILCFQSFMTGELYSLLSEQSVLRFSVVPNTWSREAFAQAVHEAFSKPALVSAKLFSLRAEGLVGRQASEGSVAARLSGYLIGLELSASQEYWREYKEVVVIGSSKLASHYLDALRLLGVEARAESAEQMTLAGLKAARKAVETLPYA